MTIATQNDLVSWCGLNGDEELTQLTDPAGLSTNALLVLDKLNQADAEVYARLSVAAIPLTSPYPKLLINVACKIARYLLYPQMKPDFVTRDYKDAISLLEDIRDGKASLGLAGDGTGPMASDAFDAPAYSAPDRVFTSTTLEAY